MVMMYISAFPIAISMRRTNVYEEQSLGIYYADEEDDKSSNQEHIVSHIRAQLSFDLWYIVLGLFILCITEGNRIDHDISFFNLLFEVMSAYCCIGASTGYPNSSQSLSGQFTTFGKLVMIFLFIRGRHRGLPYRIDRAVMLNRRALEDRDRIQEERTRHVRRMSTSIPIADVVASSGVRPFTSAVSNESEGHIRHRMNSTASSAR
jgi:Trk-type K+ transport system membrane component